MGNFKEELKEIVDKVLLSYHGDPSESGFNIQYGHEKHIITVAKLMDAFNDEKELSIDRFLSLSHPFQDTSSIILLGEIRLLDSTHDVLGSFSIGKKENQKHLFGQILYDNLRMIDGDMPRLLEAVVKIVNTTGIRKSREILMSLTESNPLHIANGREETTYRFKFGRLLYNFVLGMTEDTTWYGSVPRGGIVFAKNDICKGICFFNQTSLSHHLIDVTEFIFVGSSFCVKNG